MTGKRSAYERLKKFRNLKRKTVDDGNSENSICGDDTISASKSLIEEVDQELKVAIPEDLKCNHLNSIYICIKKFYVFQL